MEEYEKFISNYYLTLKNTPTQEYSIDCKLNLYYRIIMLELRHIMAKNGLDNRATNLVSLSRMIEPMSDVNLRDFDHELRVLQESNDYRQYPNVNYYEMGLTEFQQYETKFEKILQLLRREGNLKLGQSHKKFTLGDIREINKALQGKGQSQTKLSNIPPLVMNVTDYKETPVKSFEIKGKQTQEPKHEEKKEEILINSFTRKEEPVIQEEKVVKPEVVEKVVEEKIEEKIEIKPEPKIIEKDKIVIEKKEEPKEEIVKETVTKVTGFEKPKDKLERKTPAKSLEESFGETEEPPEKEEKPKQTNHSDLYSYGTINSFGTNQMPERKSKVMKRLTLEDKKSSRNRTINIGGTTINPEQLNREISQGGLVDYEY